MVRDTVCSFQVLDLVYRIASIVLIAFLVIVLGMPSAFVGWFKIEQDKIAATLCVQKEDLNNTCQGACQMDKMLKKVDKRADNTTAPDPNRIEIKEIQMLIEQNGSNMHEFTFAIACPDVSEKVLAGVKKSLFRPPVALWVG